MTDYRLVFDVPEPKLLLSINEQNRKGHWRRHAVTTHWRPLVAAKAMRLPRMQRAHIVVEFRHTDNRIRDTGNLYPTAKACVDGLVDAGVIPGDDDRYVVGPDLRRTWPNGARQLVIHITEITPELSGGM